MEQNNYPDKAFKELKAKMEAEIHMWRELFISQFFELGDEEYRFVQKAVREAPLGLVDTATLLKDKAKEWGFGGS